MRALSVFLAVAVIGLSLVASSPGCSGYPGPTPNLGLGAGGRFPSVPQWSPDGTKLFVVIGSSLYSVEADGSRLTTLHESKDDYDNASQVSVSPDGSRIVYARGNGEKNSEIVSSTLDGSNLTQIADSKSEDVVPVWSPDGSRIAYASVRRPDPNGRSSMWFITMAPDGSDERLVASIPDWLPAPPIWSPDSRYLVFISYSAAFVARWDGADLKHLPEFFGRPAWSPDGTRLAFAANEGLYEIDVNSSEMRQIAELPVGPHYSHISFKGPVWSPDGTRLTFATYEEVYRVGLYEIDVNSSEMRQIAELPLSAYDLGTLQWSPDGAELRSGGGTLAVFNVNESKFRVFKKQPTLGGYELKSFGPSWSPDGSMIAVSVAFERAVSVQVRREEYRDRNLVAQYIFTMRPDGSDKRVLLRIDGAEVIEGEGARLPANFDVFEWEEIPIDSAAGSENESS